MLKKMELKEGADVFTPEGEQVGKINRFILDPATNEVTHIVVQKGRLLPEDKVVPLQMITSASEEEVVLSKDVDDFDLLPSFEEKHFVKTTDADLDREQYPNYRTLPAYYWYPPMGYVGYPTYGLTYYPWPPVETRRNIPADTVPLKEGSSVISSDGKHVGDVERLILEPDSNRAILFVITHGVLFKDHKIVPSQWVKTVAEDEVFLVVPSRLLERLPSCRP